MTDRPSAPQPVAWIDKSGHPHHLRYVQGAQERHLYGLPQPLYDQAALDAAVAAAVAQERRQWITAIDEAMVCSHIGVFNDGDDPRAALNKVLAWHQVIALDPAVSSDARALQDRARAEERERFVALCERAVRDFVNPGSELPYDHGFVSACNVLKQAAIRAATPQEPT